MVEFAESLQRPLPIEKKFVIIVSTLYGCPVRCLMCDASLTYHGKLTAHEIFEQIDYIVQKRFGSKKILCEKFKIQFARVGEPAFNSNVLDVLIQLPTRYNAYGLIPCLSTIAPLGYESFFEKLLEIKNKFYNLGNFQLQFSIHTTNQKLRDQLIPIKKWGFSQIAEYGEKFFRPGNRKITLNFAMIDNNPVEPGVLKNYFNPDKFILKFTPINPTEKVKLNKLKSFIEPCRTDFRVEKLFKKLHSYGFETILSIGDLEENNIGSNCGQVIRKLTKEEEKKIIEGSLK